MSVGSLWHALCEMHSPTVFARHPHLPRVSGALAPAAQTAALSGTRKVGENCALDALNFCLGDSALITVPDIMETSNSSH